MRYRSPQAQLSIILAYVLVLLGVSNVVSPSAFKLLEQNQPAISLYRTSWPGQLVVSVSGILGIIATNVAGPRCVLLFGSLAGIAYSTGLVVSQYKIDGKWYVALLVVEDIGHTILTVCLVTIMLTYPRERRKARVLAMFQFLVNLSLTLGQVLLRDPEAGKEAAWTRLAACCVALGIAPWVAPVSGVVRDSGVYVVAQGQEGLLQEIRGLGYCLWTRSMALVVPFMFCCPFLLGTLGITFPDYLSVLLYNGGSLCGVLVLGFLLDIGSSCRRTRGLYGFTVTSFMLVVCVVAMAVLNTEDKELRGLFYSAVVVNGMAVSCVFLFSGWVIGSLSNDVEVTARFVGVNMLVVPGLGSLAASACKAGAHWPLYVGAGLAALGSLGMLVVVWRISDTNTWELARVRPAGSVVDSEQTTTYYEQSSIAKIPL
ncbi:hypothetical protein IWW39_000912 [Coemansia spiralis]|uniref:Uncharacterized protein n=1 Tax=Coemansia spiralis TaxID=417178 RepID=A0A9W8L4Z2_9FUNG|nr:hypothetical protein IWW39_000912 [Coemansia spiralis]